MENSKRIKRIITKLDELEELFHYFSNGDRSYDRDFKEIRDLIDELGLDRKKDHAEFIQKLKDDGRLKEDQES